MYLVEEGGKQGMEILLFGKGEIKGEGKMGQGSLFLRAYKNLFLSPN